MIDSDYHFTDDYGDQCAARLHGTGTELDAQPTNRSSARRPS